MSWLDALLGRVLNSGVLVPLGLGLNFTSGLRARLNLSTKYIDVDLAPGTTTPEAVAPTDGALPAIPIVLGPIELATGGGGNDDVEVISDAPYAFKILDVKYLINDVDVSGAAALRSASGGGGSLLSASVSVTTTGTYRPNDSATVSVPAGGSVYVRRTSNQWAGEVVVIGVRT